MNLRPPVDHHPAAQVQVNGVSLEYDSFGDRKHPAILLIAGLGAQMISWEEPFCRLLASLGYWVIRYDQRDTGHSTRFEAAGVPDLLSLYQAWKAGEEITVQAPYTLEDMAADALGLLDALEIDRAHVVGLSLGGMVAQLLALRHPDRVISLTSMMSMSGDLSIWDPDPETLMLMLDREAQDREAYVQQSVETSRALYGTVLELDEEWARERARRSYDRGAYPEGAARHLAALVASLGWRDELLDLEPLALVIHGSEDPLIPLDAGRDTAFAAAEAELTILRGLGHALPPVVWPQIASLIDHHARRAGARRARHHRR